MALSFESTRVTFSINFLLSNYNHYPMQIAYDRGPTAVVGRSQHSSSCSLITVMATAVVGSSVDAKEVLRQCRVAAPSSSRRKAPTEIDLTLDEYSICWTQNNKNKKISHEILLEDLIGVSVPEQASSNTREKSCSLTITHYPLITKRGGAKRCLETKSFEFCANKTFEDNRTQALEWKKAILDECERAVRKKFAFAEEHKGERSCQH